MYELVFRGRRNGGARIVIDLHAGIFSEEDEDEGDGVADSAGNDGHRWAAANAQVNYSDNASVNFLEGRHG
jgi:hypothetical protein